MLVTSTPVANKPPADWQLQVHALILEARKYAHNSHQRNQYLTQIIRLIAPKLWKFHTPYYADALQQTWLYFAKTVCTTYDPDRACIVTWLNTYLRYRHQDLVTQSLKRGTQELSIDAGGQDDDRFSTTLMEIPTREYGSLSLLEEVIQWVETDVDGELRRTHLKNRSDVNCQTLMLLRLPPETPWKEISNRFGVPIPTLSSFYRRNCIPYLRKLAHDLRINA